MPINAINNYDSNMVRVNVGNERFPIYYSVSKNNADEFYKEHKASEKSSRIISTAILLGSVCAGVFIVNKFSKNLGTFTRFVLNTIGGISAAFITTPIANTLAQNKEDTIVKKFNAYRE